MVNNAYDLISLVASTLTIIVMVLPGRKSPNGDDYVPLILQLLLQTSGKISSRDLNVLFVRTV